MTQTTHWHHMAYLYKTNGLELAEIIKVYVIITSIGLIEDKEADRGIGINVFDNSELHMALVYGVIRNLPDDSPVAYSTIGDMLLLHRNTIGRAINKLVDDEILSKEDFRPAGSLYEILEVLKYPKWLFEFTRALVEIQLDEDIHSAAAEYCKDVSFQRGWDVLKRELKEKLLPSKNK